MKYLKVIDFEEYIHYKQDLRHVAWFKWSIDKLNKHSFAKLKDNEKWLYIGIVSLCCKNHTKGVIPYDENWIRKQISSELSIENSIKALIASTLIGIVEIKEGDSIIKKRKEKIKYNNITNQQYLIANANVYKDIYSYWNSKGIIKHQVLSDIHIRAIKKALDNRYSIDDIKVAIHNYSVIVNGSKYWFKYRWSLDNFLNKGLDNFRNWDIASSSYVLRNIKTGQEKEEPKDIKTNQEKEEIRQASDWIESWGDCGQDDILEYLNKKYPDKNNKIRKILENKYIKKDDINDLIDEI